MTDVTSIFNSLSFHPARHIAWQKTADFCMRMVAIFPLTGMACMHLFPNYEALWVATCIATPMALGFGMQEIYQVRRRLYPSEQAEYRKKLSALHLDNLGNPIWNTLIQQLENNTLSARQWYLMESLFPSIEKEDRFETIVKQPPVRHLKL